MMGRRSRDRSRIGVKRSYDELEEPCLEKLDPDAGGEYGKCEGEDVLIGRLDDEAGCACQWSAER